MARHIITNKHGNPTTYFWTDKHVNQASEAVIFRKLEDESVKKVRGAYFDCKAGKVVKQ